MSGCRQIAFDTETTGFSPTAGDRMVSIAAIELVNREPTGRFKHFYLNPDRDSSPGALAVHGLTSEFLFDQPRFRDVAAELLDFFAGDEMIAHNADFDVGFVENELVLAGRRPAGRPPIVCTKILAQRKLYRRSGVKLDDLVRLFYIEDLRALTGRHGALVDTMLLVNVYRRLCDLPVHTWNLAQYGVEPDGTERATPREEVLSRKEATATAYAPPTAEGGSGVEQIVR